jgi:integrase
MMEAIRYDTTLSAQQRADLRSALRSFAGLMLQDPRAMPALPATYRPRVRRLKPSATGLSPKRLANIKSGVLRAMERYGAVRQNARGPRACAWAPLWDRLDKFQRAGLSRFVSWCSATGIVPSAVDDTVMERFRQALIDESFVKHPARHMAITCRVWERVRAAWPDLALPAVSIPRLRKTYVLPAAAFPGSFIADLDRFGESLAGADPFAEHGPSRPLKPASVKCRRYQIRQLASGCVHKGVAIASIRSLSDLVAPPTLRTGLSFFLERASGKTSAQISHLAEVARMIARHWVHCDHDTLQQIVHLTGRVSMRRQRGLTSKNRARLRQFDDRRNLERLLFYPADVMDELRRNDDGGIYVALEAEIAVAVAVLLAAPVRLANLVALRLDVHILRTRAASDCVWHLVLAAHETKNQEPREYQLGPETVAVLQEYLDRFRPRLAEPANDYIFPSGRGHKSIRTMGPALSRQILRRTGLEMNPHLFRHLAAKLILEATPGAYGIVQDVLGHRDAATTRNHYAGSETAAAARHFDTVMRQTRASLCGNGRAT